jgi:hypothetical protein
MYICFYESEQVRTGRNPHPRTDGVAEFAVDLSKLRVSKKTVSPYEMSTVQFFKCSEKRTSTGKTKI